MVANFETVGMGGIAERVPAFGTVDPLGVTTFYKGVYGAQNVLRLGVVITYHPQTHSAEVQAHGEQNIFNCIFADEPLQYAFGFSSTYPAREGEYVLFYELAPESQAGAIVGRIPYPLCFSVNGDLYGDPDQYHRRLFTQRPETRDRAITCFPPPFANQDDDTSHIATHFRPTDIYPGEFAHVNQHNCGIKGGLFSATLLGGGANLRLSALSNLARLACESYQRYSLLGIMHEFHNGRYVSSERNVAMYQEERLGGIKKEEKVWTEDSEACAKGFNQTIRPRMKDLSGFFGHLSSKFCFRPDPTESEIRVQGGGKPKEEGVCRETIDPSGQYRLSAAGMIAIERTGRIPVPVRKCYPTDKDHDIPSDPETLKPFNHDDSDPCYRQLELFDRQAYDLKTQYARTDGLGISKPDYDVPQEAELKPLKDKYDEKFTNSETVKLEKFDRRRAGVYIGEDGSVILRDAWGSEIVMLGGNVSIACPGNVMLLPGKSQLTIAGDDIVQKAQNSVDIHASEHDVRLSAAHNMEIVGGGDNSTYSGGVIIESRGTNASPWDGKDKGESAKLSGITLRSRHNRPIVMDGENIVLRARKKTRILAGSDDLNGEIGIGARIVRMRSKQSIISTGQANVVVNGGSAIMTGEQVTVAGSGNLIIEKAAKTPVPIKWADIGAIASQYNPIFDKATKDLEKEKEASIGYHVEKLEKMLFGFRTSQECNTETSWVLGASGVFKMYEPSWVQVKKIYKTLIDSNVDSKPYEENPKWENGKPFPGEEAESSAKYAQLSGLQPKNLTSEGFNVSRKSVKDSSSVTQVNLKGGYLVRKQ